QQYAESERYTGQLQRRWHTLDHQPHGRVTLPLPGIAKITLQSFAQKGKILRVQGMLEIDEQRSIQPPVVRHSFALAFAGLHGQQHVERVTGESGQTEDNDGHDPEGQETLQKPDQNVALHPSLLSYGASLMYSRWVKKPVILPGKVYSAMYFGFTVASA